MRSLDMDREAAKHALLTARAAWHKAIDARDVQWTPAAHQAEWTTIVKLLRAIEAYQAFVPDYNPKKYKGYYAYV